MRLRPFGALAFLPLSGCQGWQSALDTHGPQARSLEILFWIFLAILGTVWVLTMVGLLASLRSRREPDADPLAEDPRRQSRMTRTITVLVALTGVTVLG